MFKSKAIRRGKYGRVSSRNSGGETLGKDTTWKNKE
jgi:hypothetical protein